jgi:hypothetical protein
MALCNTCKAIPDEIRQDELGSATTGAFDGFDDTLMKIGGYVSDTYDVYLKQCPGCGTYYKYELFDSFQRGGGVGGCLRRLHDDAAVKDLARDIVVALARMSSYMGKDFHADDIRRLKELQRH